MEDGRDVPLYRRMIDKLKKCKERYLELTEDLSRQDAMNDMAAWKKKVQEHSALEEIVHEYDAYLKDIEERDNCREMLSEHLEPELKTLVQEELELIEQNLKNERKHSRNSCFRRM